LNFIDLFSGIGGFRYGAQLAEMKFENEFHSDIDEFANKVYAKNFPNSIQLGDITKIDYARLRENFGTEWIATGGFPCQPHSIAGKRKGSEDEHDLWSECVRMLRILRPRFAIFENVAAIFISDEGRFLNQVLCDIAEVGYDVEWGIIPASKIGAIHQRKRVWFITYPQKKRFNSNAVWNKKRSISSEKMAEEWAGFWFSNKSNHSFEFREKDKSKLCRMDDGLPTKLDCLRVGALGNAIVPQIAEILFRLIKPHLIKEVFE